MGLCSCRVSKLSTCSCRDLGSDRHEESPRWLIDHGRQNEAFQAFNATRAESSEDSAAIEMEFEGLVQQIKMEEGEPTSFADLFRIPSLRKRCIVGFLTLFAAQGTATLVINNYGPYLYRSLGFNTVQQLVIQGGWISVCPFGNLFNALVVDKVGRCKLLMWGFAGCIVALIGECITVSQFQRNETNGMAGAAVFFLFLHIVFFSSTTDATSYIYAAEIFPTPLRAKGLAVSVSGLFVATIIFLQAAPTAFAAISYNYFIVFIAVTFVSIIVIYFYFPEVRTICMSCCKGSGAHEVHRPSRDLSKTSASYLAIHHTLSICTSSRARYQSTTRKNWRLDDRRLPLACAGKRYTIQNQRAFSQ